jgi:hypothetical protein
MSRPISSTARTIRSPTSSPNASIRATAARRSLPVASTISRARVLNSSSVGATPKSAYSNRGSALRIEHHASVSEQSLDHIESVVI